VLHIYILRAMLNIPLHSHLQHNALSVRLLAITANIRLGRGCQRQTS